MKLLGAPHNYLPKTTPKNSMKAPETTILTEKAPDRLPWAVIMKPKLQMNTNS